MDTDCGPVLIAAGIVLKEDVASRELRKRGFIVKHCHERNGTINFAITMSKRLTTKLAAENNLPIMSIMEYSTFEQLTLANQAVKVVERAVTLKCSCWVAHDQAKRQVIDAMSNLNKDSNAALYSINSYYGPQIAMYYGFMRFYIKSLIPPMIAGILLFLHQSLNSQIDSVYLPIFCLAITLWSTFYLERWKRHCAELAYRWGVYGAEDKELTSELAKGASKEVSSVEVRRTLSMIGVLVLVLLQIYFMLYYNYIQLHYVHYVGDHWYSQVLPPIVYYLVCNHVSVWLYPVTAMLTDFEMHPTKAEAEGSLIVKRFALNFVSEFSALFYAAFVLKDLARVRMLSILSFGIHAGSIQLFQFFVPRIKHLYCTLTHKKKPPVSASRKASMVGANSSNSINFNNSSKKLNEHGSSSRLDSIEWEDVIHREIKQSEVELDDDYCEMIIQFGHLSMFAVAFPLAPLLAYVNNTFEIMSDFKKLVDARRPPVVIRSTIGAWLTCLQFLSFASVFTNCYLIAIVSINIKAIIPEAVHDFIDTDYGRLATMMVVEHLLIALKVGIMVLVDDVPQWMQESLARDKVREENQRLSQFFSSTQNDDASVSTEANTTANATTTANANGNTNGAVVSRERRLNSEASMALSAGQTANASSSTPPGTPHQQRPSLQQQNTRQATQRTFVTEQLATEENFLGKKVGGAIKRSKAESSQNDATANKLMAQCGNSYGFDPLNLSALIAVPPMLQHLGFNPFFYIPLAVLYFSYLQAAKDRTDRKTAIGIVSDPALIRLVVKDLPKWVSDSEHQRVEWFNSLMQKLWPQLSLGLEASIIEQIQEVLNAQVMAVRMNLTVKRFTLGTVSPKIVSIRLHDTQESVIRLDLEIRWAGDPSLCISMGKASYAPPVEVSEVRLSLVVRVELLDLMPSLPCFRALSVTCMKKPDVHFSLKVATLDFMNMGPADFNVTSLVRSAINSAIQDIVVYPKKIVIPMTTQDNDDEEDIAMNDSGAAVGVLYLTFEKGVNIKKSSLFGSNAYVSAHTDKNQNFRSRAIYGSRNPEWKQTFELLVFDTATQIVEVQVLDADPTRAGICLGRTNFALNNLKPAQQVRTTVDLQDVEQGSMVLSYEYLPLVSSNTEEYDEGDDAWDEDDDDVIFAAPFERGDVLCDEDGETQQPEPRRRSRTRSKVATMLTPGQQEELRSLRSNNNNSTPSENGQKGPGSPARTPSTQQWHTPDFKRRNIKYSVGIVSISMIHVRNLKFDSFFSSVSKPYVQLIIADNSKRTKALPGSTFPHYPEKFTFIVKDVAEQHLHVAVKNKNKVRHDQLLGSVDIALAEILQSEGGVEQEYILHGAQAEFYVGLRIVITGAAT